MFCNEGAKRLADQALKRLGDSLQRAKDLQDKDIDGLMALVGNGFSAVAQDLEPRLMQSVKDSRTGGWVWVPDYPARAAVVGLNAAIEAVRAQKEYSAIDTQVVLAVACLVPIALPAGLARSIASLAVNAAFLGDVAAHTIPEHFAHESEYRFALGAAGVLGSERFYMADLQRTPEWALMLDVLGVGALGVGSAVDAFVVMGKVSKQVAIPLARTVAGKIKDLGAAAIAKLTSQEQGAFFAAAAGVEIKQAAQGAQALTVEENEIRAAAQAIAEDVAKKPQAAAVVPPRKLLDPAGMFEPIDRRAMLDPVPSEPGNWRGADGKVFALDKLLSEKTGFFNVFRVKARDWVIKISKEIGEDAKMTMDGVKKAVETVRKKGIRHMEIISDVSGEERSYVVQKFLKNSFVQGEEKFIVSDYLKRSVSLPGGGKRYYQLTGDMEDAIIDFIAELKSKNVAFEDFKEDNIFLERVGGENGKFVAGVIDVDRIAEWGDFSEYMNAIASDIEGFPQEYGILSAEGNPGLSYRERRGIIPKARAIRDLDEYWSLVLEHQGMIQYLQDGSFGNGRLSFEKLAKVFPSLRNRALIDFKLRKPVVPPIPPPILALLRELFAENFRTPFAFP